MKLLSLLTMALAISFTLTAQRTPGRVTVKTSIPLEGTTFYLRNVAAQKYIDIPGAGAAARKDNGTNVQLWDLDEGDDRKVKFIPVSNGYYQIRLQHGNLNLDVHGCYASKRFCKTYKKDKGANVQIWTAGSSDPQQWKLEQVNPGQFKIINKYSGKVLDASASNINKNGCNVQQWDWVGNNNQLWELVEVSTGTRYQK